MIGPRATIVLSVFLLTMSVVMFATAHKALRQDKCDLYLIDHCARTGGLN